jgi:SAM-dependent methyltransferase
VNERAQSDRPTGAYVTENFDRRGVDVNLRAGPQMREYAQIAERVAAHGGGPVLDWGCGFGQVTSLMHERGVTVESYDFEAGSPVREAPLPRYPELSMTVSGEPVALPYPDNWFAAVVSCGVLEHVQDPHGSLDEIHRILAPGGRLFVYKLPNRRSYLEAIAKRIGLYYHGALPDDAVYDIGSAVRLVSGHRFLVNGARMANMQPLSMSSGDLASRRAGPIWECNRALSRIPLLNLLATNVELEATAV